MVDVVLKHNPFSKKTECLHLGNPIDLSSVWGTQEKTLGDWVDIFFEKLDARYNDSAYMVTFVGIERDYDILCEARDEYVSKNQEVKIEICFEKKTLVDEKFERLKDVLKDMQENAPFEEFKKDDFIGIFEKAFSSAEEITVIASMSSGKSTLLNALLGVELLPARNEATTSVVMNIHDSKDQPYFSAVVSNENNVVEKIERASLEDLNRLNTLESCRAEDEPPLSIDLYGCIKGVESKGLNLILIDTPGPNNGINKNHQRYTSSLINKDYKPMILFVLNATQLGTNDDDSLLRKVAGIMRQNNRQNNDRFLFVLNKVDALDPSKDGTPQDVVEKAKAYLEKLGIVNPKIFPCEARTAKVFRQFLNGEPLSEFEEDEILPRYRKINKREWCHYSDLAPLSKSCRARLNAMFDEVRQGNGENAEIGEALLYTGVPAVELTINEYLSKYAKPAKLSAAVDALRNKLKNGHMGFDLQKQIAICENDLKNVECSLKKNDDDISALKSSIQCVRQVGQSGLREKIHEAYTQKKNAYDLEWLEYSTALKRKGYSRLVTQGEESNICTKLKGLRLNFRNQLEASVNMVVDEYIKSKCSLMNDDFSQNAPVTRFDLENVSVDTRPLAYRKKESALSVIVKKISPLTRFSTSGRETMTLLEYIDCSIKNDNDNFFESVLEELNKFANREQSQVQNVLSLVDKQFHQDFVEKNQLRKSLERNREKISAELEMHKSVFAWVSQMDCELNRILEI